MTKKEIQLKYDNLIDDLIKLNVYIPRAYFNNQITIDKFKTSLYTRDANYKHQVVKKSDLDILIQKSNNN